MSRKNIGPIFKQILQDTLTQEGVHVETEVEVARLPRTIDAVVTISDFTVLPKLATDTPFSWFNQYNVIAFKGPNDPLTESDYHLIWGRTYLGIGEMEIPARTATLTIICGRQPRNEMERLGIDAGLNEHSQGIYQVGTQYPRCYLIVINELPLYDKRYGMLYLFTSSRKRFESYVHLIFAGQQFEIASLAALIQPEWTEEIAMIARELIPDENYEKLEAWILNDLIHMVPKQALFQKFSLEDRLAGLSLEDRVRGLSTEDAQKLRQLLESKTLDSSAE